MQKIVAVALTPEEYVESDFHEVIGAVVGCLDPHCAYPLRLHRHGKYPRFLSGLAWGVLLWIARFLCPRCRKTVSVLPSFVLTYRRVRTATVERYFRGEEEDPEVQRHWERLRDYEKDFLRHAPRLIRGMGMLLGNAVWKGDGHDFLKKLMGRYDGLASAVEALVTRFGLGLFRAYRVHGWARASVSGVGKGRGRQWRDTG